MMIFMAWMAIAIFIPVWVFSSFRLGSMTDVGRLSDSRNRLPFWHSAKPCVVYLGGYSKLVCDPRTSCCSFAHRITFASIDRLGVGSRPYCFAALRDSLRLHVLGR